MIQEYLSSLSTEGDAAFAGAGCVVLGTSFLGPGGFDHVVGQVQQFAACDRTEFVAEFSGEGADEFVDVFLAFCCSLGIAMTMAGYHAQG